MANVAATNEAASATEGGFSFLHPVSAITGAELSVAKVPISAFNFLKWV